ncbi:hypothetical protein GGX14DRAFT_403836 [Mycena pura]|uniref:Uncharacterized protein n=1 Tax=Mycena pura TaxID=153505 RepID=A0AAD6UYZ6_9AGAR|nr:hypothetical protein GGX14DRAFT_403836 [Mycena pura]
MSRRRRNVDDELPLAEPEPTVQPPGRRTRSRISAAAAQVPPAPMPQPWQQASRFANPNAEYAPLDCELIVSTFNPCLKLLLHLKLILVIGHSNRRNYHSTLLMELEVTIVVRVRTPLLKLHELGNEHR